MANTYATWNPADKNANIALSGGDLTSTVSLGGAWYAVRATIGVSSGKWYWEIYYSGAGYNIFGGIGASSATLNDFVGVDANGYAFHPSAQKVNNNTYGAYGAGVSTPTTIGWALDMVGGTITMYINNVSQGTMYSGLSGTFYPMISHFNTGSPATANFGATAMTYSPPAGHNAGVYIAGPATGDPMHMGMAF